MFGCLMRPVFLQVYLFLHSLSTWNCGMFYPSFFVLLEYYFPSPSYNLSFSPSCMSPFPSLLLFFPISPPPLQGEMMLYFSARPVVRASGQWNYSLPNPLNVSFNFHYFLIVTILLYIPCKSHFGVGNIEIIFSLCSKQYCDNLTLATPLGK